MKSFVKIIIGVLVIPALMGGLFYYLNEAGFFNITNLEVIIENQEHQPQFLRPYAQEVDKYLEAHRGSSLWSLDLNSISEVLSAKKWVAAVSLARRWPGTLRVHLTVKDVQAVLLTSAGQFLPVVKSGETLAPISLKQLPDVMLIRGKDFENKIQLRQSAMQVISELPVRGSFSQKTISELRFDQNDGFWTTLLQDGVQVKLGHEQIALKSARISQVLDYMQAQNQRPQSIDANLSKKVLVRLKSE